ncbi:MAG: hypothetical protein ABIJ59_00875 [Pseudomonadota bacterium]
MAYDPEKYREKREKVLGIKKRGIGFGTIATIVSVVIVLGLSIVTVPQAVSYMSARHLDDAIFKLESQAAWPKKVLDGIESIKGVKNVVKDKNDTRLVVTYDRRKVTISNIQNQFSRYDMDVTLLNQVNHRHHQATKKSEEKDLEAS